MRREREDKEFKEKVVQISRVTKVVKGGKKMGFRATVIIGDMKSRVGVGVGKATEVAAAIRKGVEAAKRGLINVKIIGSTIPHLVIGTSCASKVLIRPAPRGTGIIAGGSVRTMLEMAGIRNAVAKSLGSSNAINVARATENALLSLKDLEEEKALRGKDLKISYVGSEESET